MHSVVLDNVSKIFRRRTMFAKWIGREKSGGKCALRELSISVNRGEVVALLGPNGSGKTTTLKLISTLLLPDFGRVVVDGFDTCTHSQVVRTRVGIAVASERSFYPRLTARENLEFFATFDDVPRAVRRARIDAVLEQCGLSDVADTLVMKFSSGMYQRLAIARALVKQPKILLLDEPTRSLDPAGAQEFWRLLRSLRGEVTMLLATHSFAEAVAVADRVAILRQGKLQAWRAVPSTAEQLRQFYFGDTTDFAIPLEIEETEFAATVPETGAWQ
jgi:ABC-2 type transport system ATP-binding protein